MEIGLTLPTIGLPMNREANSWSAIRSFASQAEEIGFDTVWLPDELVWKFEPDFTPMGTWECVVMASAVAAVTERVKIGTWVLSALHRNPGLTVKVAEAVDEVSGGRFVFGLGAGHSGEQGKAFGYPPDKVVGRYEEALKVIVPLLREGVVSYSGEHHSAHQQENTPRGPQGSTMPLMLAGHAPRTVGLAVDYGDIWSGYATKGSEPGAFEDLLELVDRTCDERGRDPASLGRSIGVFVEPTEEEFVEASGLGVPLKGSPEETAASIHKFAEMGVTMLEVIPSPFNQPTLSYLAQVIDILDS